MPGDEDQRLQIVRDVLKVQPFQHDEIQLVLGTDERDDCAVYDFPGNLSLLVGSDFVRGPGFRLFKEKLLTYYDLGYYLVVANLSDIAAMGGEPIGITTIVRYKSQLQDEEFKELFQGINAAASLYNTPVVGGDIGEYQETVLSATALGIAKDRKYLTRKGTEPGDCLCLLGTPGLPATALAYFTRDRKQVFELPADEEQKLLVSWRKPSALIAEGQKLAGTGVVHACQDVSDGMKATIEQLARASHIAFNIQASQIPLDFTTREVARSLDVDPIALAFSASVDFNLLFTVPQNEIEVVKAALSASPASVVPFNIIGIAEEARESRLTYEDRSVSAIPGVAWKQQIADIAEVLLKQK